MTPRLPDRTPDITPTPSLATDDFVYAPPQSPYLTLLHYDQDIVVANKPSGLLSVPGKALAHQDSLYTRLARVWPDIRVVHRLDMATSGVIVFARHKAAQSHLSKQFQARSVNKTYIAEVYGQLPEPQGEVDLPLRCDWPRRPKQMVCHQQGKASLTHYEVADYCAQTHSSRVLLHPVTGRSHQLRVHMLALGCPILGDRLYGHEANQQAAARLQLHALRISLYHPSSQARIQFECAAPF